MTNETREFFIPPEGYADPSIAGNLYDNISDPNLLIPKTGATTKDVPAPEVPQVPEQ